MPQQERVLLVVTLLVGALVLATSVWRVAGVASSHEMTAASLYGVSAGLRGAIAALVVIWVLAAWAAWSYASVKAGTRLDIDGDGTLRYVRPDVPIVGRGGEELTVAREHVDDLRVLRARRVGGMRTELRVRAGRDEIALNLDHALGPEHTPDGRPVPRDTWLTHPLVVEVAEATGRDVSRG